MSSRLPFSRAWVERLPYWGSDEPDPDPVMGNQAPADWSREVASDSLLSDAARKRLGLPLVIRGGRRPE